MTTLSPVLTPFAGEHLDDQKLLVDRASRYVEEEYLSGKLPLGSRLPPVRKLAQQLEVSNAIIHNLYRRLQEEGRVISVVGRGTFLAPQPPASPAVAPNQAPATLALSLLYIHGELDDWQGGFLSALMEATQRDGNSFNFLPFAASAASAQQGIVRTLIDAIPRVDGLILSPLQRGENRRVLDAYQKAGKPVISVNPPSAMATADFVSSDYYRFGLQMGKVWLESGRERMLFLGPEVWDAPSSVQRLAGFHAALGPHHEKLRVVYADGTDREAGVRAVRGLLAQGYRPDAVFAFGDYLAMGALEALREGGLSLPEEVSLVGGTGTRFAAELGISANRNLYLEIGDVAIAMMKQRLASGGASVPGRYVPMAFFPAGSTREVENRLWEEFSRF